MNENSPKGRRAKLEIKSATGALPVGIYVICHSVPDTESILDTFWIPAACFRRDKLHRNDTGGSTVKSFNRHYTTFDSLKPRCLNCY